MQLIDYLLLVIVGLSTMLSLFRGFFREALSLGAWVLGLWLAWKLGPDFAGYLKQWISEPEVRLWVVRFLIVFAALLAGALLATLFSLILDSAGLSGTDRVIGSAFGFARGVLLAALLVMALELMGFQQATWWDESKLIPYAAPVVDIIRSAADDGLELLNDQDESTDLEAIGDAADVAGSGSETQ